MLLRMIKLWENVRIPDLSKATKDKIAKLSFFDAANAKSFVASRKYDHIFGFCHGLA